MLTMCNPNVIKQFFFLVINQHIHIQYNRVPTNSRHKKKQQLNLMVEQQSSLWWRVSIHLGVFTPHCFQVHLKMEDVLAVQLHNKGAWKLIRFSKFQRIFLSFQSKLQKWWRHSHLYCVFRLQVCVQVCSVYLLLDIANYFSGKHKIAFSFRISMWMEIVLTMLSYVHKLF